MLQWKYGGARSDKRAGFSTLFKLSRTHERLLEKLALIKVHIRKKGGICMALLFWGGGGREPQDAALVGLNGSIATYTGTPKKAEIEVHVAPGFETSGTTTGGYKRPEERIPEEGDQKSEEQEKGSHYGEILARASARAAEVVAESKKPGSTLGKSAKSNPAKKPESPAGKVIGPIRPSSRGSAVRTSTITTPLKPTGRGLLMRSGSALSGVARHHDLGDSPINVIMEDDDRQRLPILMTLTRESAALELELSEKPQQEEPRPGTIIGFPLTEEQQKAENFYRQTGMKYEDFKEIFEPTWSVAEMLSPRLNAEKAWRRICDCRYDAEMVAYKAKKVVRDFLYKRRPVAAKE